MQRIAVDQRVARLVLLEVEVRGARKINMSLNKHRGDPNGLRMWSRGW